MKESLNYETIDSLYEYTNRLIPAVLNLSTKLRNIKDEDTMELMKAAIEGIEWSFNAILLNMDFLRENNIVLDEGKIKTTLIEFSESLENKDLLLVSDILEYEIVEILNDVNRRVEPLLNKTNI
ncbi:MAG: hypothetical protein N4A68_18550 [Maledivibacter sp.]|jgi:hypothetical protein|nr:hypothetical protein [Maledivibacter sp.]